MLTRCRTPFRQYVTFHKRLKLLQATLPSLSHPSSSLSSSSSQHPRPLSTFQAPDTAGPSRRHPHAWKQTLLYTAGGVTCAVCVWLGYRFQHTTTAVCKAKNVTNPSPSVSTVNTIGREKICQGVSQLPPLTLYQYQTCPFCCKTRAYLDYYGIAYDVVEVNPLLRREIKFSKYRKVPFIVSEDVQVNDSSLLISVLQTCLVNEGKLSVNQSLDLYPEMSFTDDKGKTHTERANKYFIMLGEDGNTKGVSLAERREEREWRQWVDDKLVHVLPPNIYRTPSEALQAFDYISKVGNFNAFEKAAAKYVGAFGMYFIAKLLKKKYKLDSDVRKSLYDLCTQWGSAVGKDRKFMGGNEPNLADLAVYGVLSSIEGYDSFKDMLEHTTIGPWYMATQQLVQQNEVTQIKVDTHE